MTKRMWYKFIVDEAGVFLHYYNNMTIQTKSNLPQIEF